MIRFVPVRPGDGHRLVEDLGDVVGDALVKQALTTELRTGECEGWKVQVEGTTRARLITRVERCPHTEHETLVIVALAGEKLKNFAPAIINHAKRLGLGSIRFHTRRKALGRYMQEYGFEPLEYVFHKRLNHGQINEPISDHSDN